MIVKKTDRDDGMELNYDRYKSKMKESENVDGDLGRTLGLT